MNQQLSPVSERRTRFLTSVLQERTRQERDWSAKHDLDHTRLEWAGLLTSYALRVWSSETPRRACVQLAALCLALVERLDADPTQLTDLEEHQLRSEAAATPEMYRVLNAKRAALRGGH